MKKIISFSLYGWDYKYFRGALCNAELAQIIYPDWICRFYCGTSVPENIVNQLKSYENTEVILMEENTPYSYMMWRFLPVDEDDVAVTLSRDTDSRLSYREKFCVDIFMESDTLFHSIQDHTCHDNVMGGMWGMKKNDRINMRKLAEEWKGGLGYFSDQAFMREIIKPKFTDSIMIHCSHHLCNFPIEKTNNHYVGEIFFEDNYGKPNNYIFY
jgi:protein O-GlcNAc transferase